MPVGLAWIALGGCVRILELAPEAIDEVPKDRAHTGTPEATVCVPGDTLGFSLPSARWGLAALYASRRLDDRPDSALRLTPSFFLATGWQISGFGCATYGAPWSGVELGDAGCLGLREETVFRELCNLYPLDYTCDGYPGAFDGDAPEASALGLALDATDPVAQVGHALLERRPAAVLAQHQFGTRPVSYTHLTLPTNREV